MEWIWDHESHKTSVLRFLHKESHMCWLMMTLASVLYAVIMYYNVALFLILHCNMLDVDLNKNELMLAVSVSWHMYTLRMCQFFHNVHFPPKSYPPGCGEYLKEWNKIVWLYKYVIFVFCMAAFFSGRENCKDKRVLDFTVLWIDRVFWMYIFFHVYMKFTNNVCTAILILCSADTDVA